MGKTNEGRLERIKQSESATDYLLGGTALKGDWSWLIEQAETADKFEDYSIGLKSERDFWKAEHERMYGKNLRLEQEKERLRLTLEEVLDLSKHDCESRYLDKCYVVVRKALEGTK